jgi:hypothetical protein
MRPSLWDHRAGPLHVRSKNGNPGPRRSRSKRGCGRLTASSNTALSTEARLHCRYPIVRDRKRGQGNETAYPRKENCKQVGAAARKCLLKLSSTSLPHTIEQTSKTSYIGCRRTGYKQLHVHTRSSSTFLTNHPRCFSLSTPLARQVLLLHHKQRIFSSPRGS